MPPETMKKADILACLFFGFSQRLCMPMGLNESARLFLRDGGFGLRAFGLRFKLTHVDFKDAR